MIELFVGRYEMPNNMHYTITQYEGNKEWMFRNTTTFQFFRANQSQLQKMNSFIKAL